MDAASPSPVAILGDSHVRYFRQAAEFGLFGARAVEICEVSGATASGLNNPDSFTAAGQRYRKFLKRQDPRAILVLHLGEVDCGMLIWMRAAKREISLRSSLNVSLKAYLGFLDEILEPGGIRLVLTGATLPTISDTDQLGSVVNQRRSKISATQVERTALTLDFNARLEAEARARGLPYADVRDLVVDPRTGLVDTGLRNSDPADHHMDLTLAAVPWGIRVSAALDHYEPVPAPVLQWLAVGDSVVAASPGVDLADPAGRCVRVGPGQRLAAQKIGQAQAWTIVNAGVLDGQPLPAGMNFLPAQGWTPAASP